jgi:hypothetical protein
MAFDWVWSDINNGAMVERKRENLWIKFNLNGRIAVGIRTNGPNRQCMNGHSEIKLEWPAQIWNAISFTTRRGDF